MGDVYPRIKRMAQDVLAVTATSVPSEIALSAAGIAVNTRCARLDDDTIKAICELKSSYSFNRHLSDKDSST
ncbi:hypothetical protein ON010_g7635 [Phytophthora cinnamomi]|nr:hypothetical protein ON010_g7635 [Phytophthora cinnamomi]